MAPGAPSAPNLDIKINGGEVSDADHISMVIDRDMFQPDSATIVLSNKNDIYSGKFEIGGTVEVTIGNKQAFIGEVTGLRGRYKGGDTTTLTVEAHNRMRRLLQFRTSKTFEKMNDQKAIQQALDLSGSELKLEFQHEKPITYNHIYWHNLTALEFIRMRAARIGCYVWCKDKTLYVKEPDFSKVNDLNYGVDDASGNLRAFYPRISSAAVVDRVQVVGWDPEKKERIVGEATQKSSGLGTMDCIRASKLKSKDTFNVDLPIWSKEEAQVLAKARLRDLNMQFMTAEAECAANGEVDLGDVVPFTANAMKKDDPFNGKYYVVGITHRHTMPKMSDGGQVTIFRLARDGQGG